MLEEIGHLKGSIHVVVPLFGLALYAAYNVLQVLRNPNSKLPGPWYSQWTGLVMTYHWLKGNRACYVHDLHEKYGPVVRVGPNEVEFTSVDVVKSIYAFKETFLKSEFYSNVTASGPKSPNVFATRDPPTHKRLRRFLAGPMAESSLKHVEPQMHDHVEFAIRRMKEEMETRGATDVWKWWSFMTTDLIGNLTFGESFRTLDQGKHSQYSLDLANIAPLGAIRSTFPSLIPLTSYMPLPFLKSAHQASLRMTQYSRESLGRYQRLLDSDPSRAQVTLLKNVFQAKEDDKMSVDEVRTTAQAYIVAGTDTTANTLTYLTWQVTRHPAIRDRLVKEIQSLPADFKDPDLRQLPFLNQIVEETLRLHGAVMVGLPRVVPKGGAELDGYWIPEDTIVLGQAYSVHRNPDVFPNPDEFDPSRWEDPSKTMKDSLIAFGRGARVCLGLHLAYMELRRGAVRFFQEFPNAKVSSMNGMSDAGMKPLTYFLITPTGKQCLIEA